MKKNILLSLFIVLFAFAALPSAAFAISSPQTFNFNAIDAAPSQSIKDIHESRLYVEVYDDSDSTVKFNFHRYNNSGDISDTAVTEIYFADKSMRHLLDYDDSPITNYSDKDIAVSSEDNHKFPEGSSTGFSKTGESGSQSTLAPTQGINKEAAENKSSPAEQLDVCFNNPVKDKNNYYTYQQLTEALNDGSTDIGINVQTIGAYN